MAEPEYACGLIADARGWWLLQLRPPAKALAPSQLICFGGRREPGETALACLRRELVEETGWTPSGFTPAVELRDGERFIARFYHATLAVPLAALRVEPGHVAVLAPPRALPGLPVSPWHRRVLDAVAAGMTVVDLSTETPRRSPGA